MAFELKLYDTLTREKRPFKPLDPANVRMYVCGPTVYDYAHIGNARPVIVFDVLFRLLRHIYGPEHVTYVRNITDVDDKINARAAERGISIRELTEETYQNFKSDVAALGCLPPTVEPRATEHIEQMKALIERLVADGHAYVEQEHVLFSVPSMQDYGRLSKRPMDEMIAGARVEVAPYKRDPQDFVLWKPSKAGEPGWPSPCGIATAGRPGWHIECSAMSDYWLWRKAQGTLSQAGLSHPHQFDIHGGGIDLVFPHHENEIAQSRCAFHTPVMANFWMHNGFLQVEGEKMSKSLGNFVTIQELLSTDKFGGQSWSGGVVRLAMLRTHYRQPIDWTAKALEDAHKELESWANALGGSDAMLNAIGQRSIGKAPVPAQQIVDALADDLNTPKALTELRQLFADMRNNRHEAGAKLMESCEFLGLLTADRLFAYNRYHVGSGGKLIPPALRPKLDKLQIALLNGQEDRKIALIAELKRDGVKAEIRENGAVSYEVIGNAVDVAQLIMARNAARSRKDWKESDRIRDELAAMGVVLKDGKDGTTWEIAR